jgi:hypothetical protein
MFNVFNKISFDKSFFTEFYHYTGLEVNKEKKDIFNKLLYCPTFFSPTPIYYSKKAIYYRNKKCLFFDVENDIDKLLDLTDNITINNPFIKQKEIDKDEIKFYAFNQMDKYYEEKDIPLQKDIRYKCLEVNNEKKLKDVFEEKKYCDINSSNYYVGRRKLQEILFKTRKYMYRDIWEENHEHTDSDKRVINRDLLKIEQYHPSNYKCIIYSYNYDAILLNELNITGYFFTDYIDRIFTGGEIMLTKPKNHIKLKAFSKSKCFDKRLERELFD